MAAIPTSTAPRLNHTRVITMLRVSCKLSPRPRPGKNASTHDTGMAAKPEVDPDAQAHAGADAPRALHAGGHPLGRPRPDAPGVRRPPGVQVASTTRGRCATTSGGWGARADWLDDLAQEALIQLAEAVVPAYDASRGPFRPYLKAALRNLLRDRYRSKRPDVPLPEGLAAPEPAGEDSEDPAESAVPDLGLLLARARGGVRAVPAVRAPGAPAGGADPGAVGPARRRPGGHRIALRATVEPAGADAAGAGGGPFRGVGGVAAAPGGCAGAVVVAERWVGDGAGVV